MNRKQRATWAAETVQICQSGKYIAHDGRHVDVWALIDRARARTVTYDGAKMSPPPQGRHQRPAQIEVTDESTFAAMSRAAKEESGHVGCLNFASAKNPGGGFLNGSQAQEEALARSSALHACLQTQFDNYYQPNRQESSALYLDRLIVSPLVPFFRDDDSRLLACPVPATVITAPAPNAGAVARNEPDRQSEVRPTLQRRAELVLRAATLHGVDTLVLGAWGCGVFGNNPRDVADIFAQCLRPDGSYASAFARVIFAVYDPTETRENYRAFEETLSSFA